MGQLCGFDQIQEGYGSVSFTLPRVLGYMCPVFRVDTLLAKAIDAAMKASCTVLSLPVNSFSANATKNVKVR
jgi:hypothetical protein